MSNASNEAARCKNVDCHGYVRAVDANSDKEACANYSAAHQGEEASFICELCSAIYPEEDYLELSLDSFEARIKPASE